MPNSCEMRSDEIKVVHLIGGDLSAGASRGAYEIHKGLLAQGIHSRILTDSYTDLFDETITSVALDNTGKLSRTLRRALDSSPKLFYRNRQKTVFSTGLAGIRLDNFSSYAEATVVHLHWFNGGFVSLRSLKRIRKPIVWTLRDMWPMTGGCHYAMGCTRYLTGCGGCPQLGSTSRLDLSRVALAAKQRLVPAEAKVVGISRWLAAQAMKSPVFNAHEISTISNCISTRDYFPVDKAVAKSLLTLTSKKKIILVGAQALATYYKGFDYFLQSLNFLDREKYHLCFFGALDPNEIAHLDFSYTIFGFLHDTISLRLAYSAADVFVAPSIMEAFGKTLAEAMACGTPVVCFDSTGPRDIVDHLENGYKAVSYEPADLARGVEWACFHQEPEKLGSSARQKVVASFDSEVIARKYIDVYKDALGLI